MAADPDIRVLHIATPNHLHFPQVQTALAHKKHVICEKPLTLTSEESRMLLELDRFSGLAAAVCYNLRYYPLVHEARQMIRSGELGEVLLIQGSYLQDWLLFPTDWNWRLEPEKGGILRTVRDIGTHWLDMMRFVTGLEIEAVTADFLTAHRKRIRPAKETAAFRGGEGHKEEVTITTEDYAGVLLRFSNGARGSLNVSQISAGRKNRL